MVRDASGDGFGTGRGFPGRLGFGHVLPGAGQFHRAQRRELRLPETDGHVREELTELHQLGRQE